VQVPSILKYTTKLSKVKHCCEDKLDFSNKNFGL